MKNGEETTDVLRVAKAAEQDRDAMSRALRSYLRELAEAKPVTVVTIPIDGDFPAQPEPVPTPAPPAFAK